MNVITRGNNPVFIIFRGNKIYYDTGLSLIKEYTLQKLHLTHCLITKNLYKEKSTLINTE